jgi:ribosomal protein S18 acetylase RimI-like enzyme
MDQPAPVVRDATMADLAALERCLPRADHAERIRTADGRARRYLVAESGGEVAGFARLFLTGSRSEPDALPFPRMANLNVRPDMRGRGLATALIREMERLARAAGHEAIYLGVHEENAPARSLYERLGYRPIEGAPLDAARRVVRMAKRLRPRKGGRKAGLAAKRRKMRKRKSR